MYPVFTSPYTDSNDEPVYGLHAKHDQDQEIMRNQIQILQVLLRSKQTSSKYGSRMQASQPA